MGVIIRYGVCKGNTVPYPPNFDEIQQNFGFIDTRGRPDLVDNIPEAQESPALATLLSMLALPSAHFISLGCDLGGHDEPKARIEARRVAGGYVQIATGADHEYRYQDLQALGRLIESSLKKLVGDDRWEVRLLLSPVRLVIAEEIDAQSVFIWFFAKSSTKDRAIASRERLIEAITGIIKAFDAEQAIV